MRLVFAFWLAIPAFACASFQPPFLEDAAQDSQGNVWAYRRSQGTPIYRFDGTQWSAQPTPLDQPQSALPSKVVRMTDGAVACIWTCGGTQIAVTRHLGGDTRLLGTCPGEISPGGLIVPPFADSQNRLWITQESPKIYRADGKGGVKLIREITPDEFNNPGPGRQYNALHTIEDGHGRIWIWSALVGSNCYSLRGMLVFTGDQAVLRDSISGLNVGSISTIARADDRHMWVTVLNDGLYRVDIDSWTAERMTSPAIDAFTRVRELYVQGDDLYVVASSLMQRSELWRRRGGQWAEIIPQFDVNQQLFSSRVWLPVKEGLLVQSYGSGPWFIPKQGPPAQFSWQTNPPLGETRALTQLPDGTFLGFARDGTIFHGPISFPPHESASSRVVNIEGDQGWVFASTGHVWMIPHDGPPLLKEWDGFKWILHPFPPGTRQAGDLIEDDQGRLWAHSQAVEINIFDPSTGQWQSFPDFNAAFLALKNHPPRFLNDKWFLTPQYSADHQRVAFRKWVSEIDYFNGRNWQYWKRKEITAETGSDGAVGPPWFDEKGLLHVNMRSKTSWQWDDTGKWAKIPYVTHFPADIWSEDSVNRSLSVAPPDGCVTSHPDSCVLDNLGTYWLNWNGALYRAIPGLCVKVFADGEPDPFRLPHQLREVQVDAQGNAFLYSAAYTMERMMIRPKAPAPKSRIDLEQKTADSVVAHFHSDSPNVITWRWQLDDNAPALGKADSVALDNLPNGPHLLKVTAIDDQLNMDASLATAKFEVHVQPGEQLALLIAQLSDPDYARRKAAIAALALQPAAARPALLKARANATEDQQWWIDAALQEGERSSQSQLQKPK